MKNGICPKCGLTEVYRGTSRDGEGLSAGSYNSLIEILTGKTLTTLWLETFICCGCGYIEMHVGNREDLVVLSQADGWEKIETQRKGEEL